jgi:hypothetical protein
LDGRANDNWFLGYISMGGYNLNTAMMTTKRKLLSQSTSDLGLSAGYQLPAGVFTYLNPRWVLAGRVSDLNGFVFGKGLNRGGARNGQPTISLANNYLFRATARTFTAFTSIFVTTNSFTGANARLLSLADYTDYERTTSIIQFQGANFGAWRNSSFIASAGSYRGWGIFVTSYNGAQVINTLHQVGGSSTTGTFNLSNQQFTTTRQSIGMQVGGASPAIEDVGSYWNGDVAEGAVWDRALTSGELDAYIAYLKARYNI